MTITLADGDMCELSGFGVCKSIAQPVTTIVRGIPGGSVRYPATPTVMGREALVRLDGDVFVFTETRHRWTKVERIGFTKRTPEQNAALKEIRPQRFVVIRIFQPRLDRLPIFVLVDDRLGMPILAIGDIETCAPGAGGARGADVNMGIEWHPEGYSPTWLEAAMRPPSTPDKFRSAIR